MPHYRSVGEVSRKRHTQFRDAAGALLYEELVGEEGFSADSALLYHRGLPAAIVDSQPWALRDAALAANHPLRPRHFRLPELFAPPLWGATDAVTGRRTILGNRDVRIAYVVASAPSPLYRNACGDECVFVEAGEAVVETSFGALAVAAGDYVVLPRGTLHRWLPREGPPLRAFAIEAESHVAPPQRYRSKTGQLLEHAPYCERDLRAPSAPLLAEGRDVPVHVKHRGPSGELLGSVLVMAEHPFDVVGWDGCLYPFALNVHDFEPQTGRVHLPPPVHQVFEGHGFVVCNFVPRKLDYHPLAIPAPYYHANVDSDEVLFYVAGDYGARRGSGIAAGSVSLHPGGHTHGPQPGAYAASIGRERADELAVMVDTFAPLALGEGARASEDAAYAWTWSGRGPSAR
ncbi:MAG: homogentisate 1,2-dioxygenase [Myxococcota bacterium]